MRAVILANRQSGTNRQDAEVLERACTAFGEGCEIITLDPDTDLSDLIDHKINEGAEAVISAGGDGTAMAIANAMLGREVPMGVLPMGTFNYFTRGLGMSEVPEEAAAQLRDGEAHDIRIGQVNGRAFLNNASLGVYPAILKKREAIYDRWGRHRVVAYWSVIKTILQTQHRMKLSITADGTTHEVKTPLVFIARSAYQLDVFGLDGAETISEDGFATFVIHARSRMDLMRLAVTLAARKMPPRQDFTLIRAHEVVIEHQGKAQPPFLTAFDGEKARLSAPLRLSMSEAPLRILTPKSTPQKTEDHIAA
ncbi:diacylglycerol kinase family protein [uncultured Celeribacter sp.]|uniref:diacylglycerol/lipid kinase family protein n=1 Tax=uncultured Celeribacter sp. TaxID=1303376 RepID=UPI002AA86310|nr:diacylglycerol kinase family protein [uncultured Celeribacter sp.]